MTKDELISFIRERFQEGKRRSDIKEQLLQEGFFEEDVDEAMDQIQHDAVRQLPIISSVYKIIDDFESKSSLASPRNTVILMAVCVGSLILIAAILYFVFDPLGTQSNARDVERRDDLAKIQTALEFYYQQNHSYPGSLNKLVPEYLTNVPLDPQTGQAYSYTLNNSSEYVLCISYELVAKQCVSPADQSSSVIPIIPTATPEVQYVPQSATGNSGSNSVSPSQVVPSGGIQ